MKPVVFHELLLPEEAVAKVESVLGGLKPLGSERVSLNAAAGRVLAETVCAKADSPPFDRSEVDGYAVAAQSVYGAEEDKPIALRIIGESVVGESPKFEVKKDETAEIATGAPIPRGANAVVMVEYTKRENQSVLVYRSVVPGENIAQTGSDVSIGDVALRAGTLLTPREIAVLAALGYGDVDVYRKPKVAVFSTGDEVVPPGRTLPAAKVFDINGVTLITLFQENGAAADYGGILKDDPPEIKRTLAKGIEEYDILVTSGSTSAGLGDVIYRIFDELGSPGIVVHGLRIKPGKPTVAAVVNGKIALGLPGFPVSAMIAFAVFMKPLLAKLTGMGHQQQAVTYPCSMALRLQAGKGRREFIPVNI
ncbi:MAG: gephyrin-like molybdotransferase Glp, partial [Candidatus Bathyarchaeia archaeon]